MISLASVLLTLKSVDAINYGCFVSKWISCKQLKYLNQMARECVRKFSITFCPFAVCLFNSRVAAFICCFSRRKTFEIFFKILLFSISKSIAFYTFAVLLSVFLSLRSLVCWHNLRSLPLTWICSSTFDFAYLLGLWCSKLHFRWHHWIFQLHSQHRILFLVVS